MRLFVSNFSYDVTSEELRALFEHYGPVREAVVVLERGTGASRGFGFVEYEDPAIGQAAMDALNGYPWRDRPLAVRLATPRGSAVKC